MTNAERHSDQRTDMELLDALWQNLNAQYEQTASKRPTRRRALEHEGCYLHLQLGRRCFQRLLQTELAVDNRVMNCAAAVLENVGCRNFKQIACSLDDALWQQLGVMIWAHGTVVHVGVSVLRVLSARALDGTVFLNRLDAFLNAACDSTRKRYGSRCYVVSFRENDRSSLQAIAVDRPL